MDQGKIGKFIAECRKKQNLTQMQLAEELNITDRAVSKWETGKAMPDSSIMLELCRILDISVNDLLCGEVVTVENYNKELENNLLEMTKQKELADKRLLNIGLVLRVVCIVPIVAAVVIVSMMPLEQRIQTVIVIAGILPLFIATPFILKTDLIAGYYECAKCRHRYVPIYKGISMSIHVGRTRYAACPKCGQKSWQKKVLSRD